MRMSAVAIAASLVLIPQMGAALLPSGPTCQSVADTLNTQFMTMSPLQTDGSMPEDAGVLVHTIHGPIPKSPPPPPKGTYLNIKHIRSLGVDADAKCGDLMAGTSGFDGTNPVFLPWCGSNRKPTDPRKLSDASSWTYLRTDTLLNSTARNTDEVVCRSSDNKHYGLIFSNAYMNTGDNLGCMFPLDGDTGSRVQQGCGPSLNPSVSGLGHNGPCTFAAGATLDEKITKYISDYNNLLSISPSLAGSRVCSLSKDQFDVWVGVRQQINLTHTDWPENEFVLRNWDMLSTNEIADNGILVGIYYATGCVDGTQGNAEDANRIAKLYSDWTGTQVPVFELDNAAIAAGTQTPFQCPATPIQVQTGD